MAVLLGAGLAETLKSMATYVSSRIQLRTVMPAFFVGAVAVFVVQLGVAAFNHAEINLTVYALEFGIISLVVAQRFGA